MIDRYILLEDIANNPDISLVDRVSIYLYSNLNDVGTTTNTNKLSDGLMEQRTTTCYTGEISRGNKEIPIPQLLESLIFRYDPSDSLNTRRLLDYSILLSTYNDELADAFLEDVKEKVNIV